MLLSHVSTLFSIVPSILARQRKRLERARFSLLGSFGARSLFCVTNLLNRIIHGGNPSGDLDLRNREDLSSTTSESLANAVSAGTYLKTANAVPAQREKSTRSVDRRALRKRNAMRSAVSRAKRRNVNGSSPAKQRLNSNVMNVSSRAKRKMQQSGPRKKRAPVNELRNERVSHERP